MVTRDADGWSLCCDCGKSLFVRHQDDEDRRCYHCEQVANPPKPPGYKAPLPYRQSDTCYGR